MNSYQWNPFYVDEEDEDDKQEYKPECKYIIDPEMGTKCRRTATTGSDYCIIHRGRKCYCATQATHNCEYCIRQGIEYPLCDEPFCSADHNVSKKKHVKTVHDW